MAALRGVTLGSAPVEGVARNGWFVGHFIDDDPLRQSSDVEVKWGIHRQGERNETGFVANQKSATLSILISGRFRLWFRQDGQEHPVEFDTPGQYALWLPDVSHHWEAVTDCVVLTVRWPSIPKDQQ